MTHVLELTLHAAAQVLEAGLSSRRWTLRWLAVLCVGGAALLGGTGGGWLGLLAILTLLVSLKVR
ncbi:hypothetical protein [Deinococcus radiotolerans]|uniref:Uncharacterized protein n=1 Tax=Deinococcus radiotolerans TaxID=1309407 RepID=A0ABQ2FHJ3_9DEIO|nr:hypothetical protein [Deinococcus radiotolerans]GGK95825.1 hypothetical protein GCM10010844_12860 [Deinococcus radiotolerans]